MVVSVAVASAVSSAAVSYLRNLRVGFSVYRHKIAANEINTGMTSDCHAMYSRDIWAFE